MGQQILIIVLSIVVLLLMGGTLLFFYFRSLRHELETDWLIVLDNLRLRLDKIPNLLETVRAFAPGETKLIDDLAKLRSASWPLENGDKEKVTKESAVSTGVKTAWALAKKYPEMARDTNFLALRTEFKELGIEIEKSVEFYNKRVRRYNSIVRFILFLPVSLLMRFPKIQLFAFEV